MKQLVIFSILIFLLSGCGNKKVTSVDDIIATENLEQIRAKKTALDKEQQALQAQLVLLEAEIKRLDPQEKIPLITVSAVTQEKFEHYIELQGSVDTKQNLLVYPEFSGVLTYVYVTEGQRVSKGQSLAKIDDGGLNQQLAQIQIQTDLAKTTLDRQERLWNQKIGTEMQFLQAKSSYEAQLKAINQLQAQINKTIVRAPFSGTIDDVITEQGSVVAPGQSMLFRIVSLRDMYIETDVPERYISDITKGKEVFVEFPILGKSLESKVRQAGNFINPANRTYKIEVAVPNKDRLIKPNLTAKLKINDYTNDSAIMIPLSIISENAEGQEYVYIISDKAQEKAKAKRIIIETGRTQGDLIEILAGLENGDEIIIEGARSVKDGQEVKILNVEETNPTI